VLEGSSGKIIEANAFMWGLLGQEPEQLLGKELHEIGLFEDSAANKEVFLDLQRKGYLRYDNLPVQEPTLPTGP
jgi:PAS domain-containing protein